MFSQHTLHYVHMYHIQKNEKHCQNKTEDESNVSTIICHGSKDDVLECMLLRD